MEYKSLTKAERDAIVAEAIHAREVEYFHYALNVVNYNNLLVAMSEVPDWNESLEYLKGRTRDEVIRLAKQDGDTTSALAIMEKDRLKRLLKSEEHELAKVASYHSQLVSQFTSPEELTSALAAAKAKRDVAIAQRV